MKVNEDEEEETVAVEDEGLDRVDELVSILERLRGCSGCESVDHPRDSRGVVVPCDARKVG